MCSRQSSRVGDTSYLKPGQFQLGVGFRTLDSHDHFKGRERQYQRDALGTYVINRQNMLDISGTYAVSDRFNLQVSVPYLTGGSWGIPIPINASGTRETMNSGGIGDIVVGGRWWIRDPGSAKNANIALGIGLKMPTGRYKNKDVFPNRDGSNVVPKYADISIQPGDGGWGISLSGEGFRTVGRTTWFASGVYLISPRDTNGTPSIRAALGIAPDPNFPSLSVNSVPDQYLYRAGAGFRVARGLGASLAARAEGTPSNDLIGRSNGFRRPGYSVSVEPGLSYSRGDTTWGLSVPIRLLANRRPTHADGGQQIGDATFPDYMVLLGVSRRWGQ